MHNHQLEVIFEGGHQENNKLKGAVMIKIQIKIHTQRNFKFFCHLEVFLLLTAIKNVTPLHVKYLQ